jgi:F0F1-type ATP synthase assembly protein I
MSEPKYKKTLEGIDQLSLGISMVVAVVIGVAIGLGLKSLFGYAWLFWLGVFWGIGGAVNNVYRAYKKQQKDLEQLANELERKFNDR